MSKDKREPNRPGLLAHIWIVLLVIAFGALAAAVGMLADLITISVDPRLPVALAGIGIVCALIGLFGIEGVFSRLNHQISALERQHNTDRRSVQEALAHSRSLYDLAFMMGSTLDFQRILEAALEAGRLGMRHTDENLVSAVMLFHAGDNLLHVVSSRRLTRKDENLSVPGKAGVIGTALQSAEPAISDKAISDPELQYFAAFQPCRSVLCIPLRTGYDNFGVLIYGSEQPAAFSVEQSDLLTAIGIQETLALQNALLCQSLREERDKIIAIEEESRKKLARDLHDGPTQSIAAIAMRMGYIISLIDKMPQRIPDELHKVEELARSTTREIRHMLFTLRPLALETQGLGVALQQLADKMKETYDQQVLVQVSPEAQRLLSPHEQGVVFYIIEEGINNARKHAQATIIKVSIFAKGSQYVVAQIADNGVGFDSSNLAAGYDKRGSLGMVNMHERAEMIDASLKLESRPGSGTIVTLLIPIDAQPGGSNAVGATRLALAANERAGQTGTPPNRGSSL